MLAAVAAASPATAGRRPVAVRASHPVEFLADDEVAVTFRAVLLTGAG
jgi:hypothetical protein